MILKTLSVIVLCATFGAAAGPVFAHRTPGVQKQSGGKTPATAPQTQGDSRAKPWWADDKIKTELGLTADQVKAIDDVYMSTKDELASYRESTERERKELDRLIAESKLEQWQILRQIDRMETARANHNKSFYMMLYRMNRQLTVEQRLKLQTVLDRQRRGGRDGRGGERRDPKPAR
jgi:Spy/CpxP family protein refolding chaperone